MVAIINHGSMTPDITFILKQDEQIFNFNKGTVEEKDFKFLN